PGLDTSSLLVRSAIIGFSLLALLNRRRIAASLDLDRLPAVRSAGGLMNIAAGILLSIVIASAGLYLSRGEAKAFAPMDWFDPSKMAEWFGGQNVSMGVTGY